MMKNEISHSKIIACTAYVNEDDKAECFSCGMDEYIQKPVNTKVIKSIID